MNIGETIERLRAHFDGLRAPAPNSALERLNEQVGPLPGDVIALYRDHDGSTSLPRHGAASLPVRLLPVEELLETDEKVFGILQSLPSAGNVVLLWTDDNSNYLGVYTDGKLAGYLACVDHEGPMLAPAYRSVPDFYDAVFASTQQHPECIDIPSLRRDLPAISDQSEHLIADREMALNFWRAFEEDHREHHRRFAAFCAMALTPVADSEMVVRLIDDADMWVGDAAVCLLELRDNREQTVIHALERAATQRDDNTSSAALRYLVRMGSPASGEVLSRLQTRLTDSQREVLDMWLRVPMLLPPQWP